MSVSLYGDTALIGTIYDDDNDKSNSGSVYVFTRSSVDGTFEQQSKLHASDAAASDYFGGSVSLYGDTALIGAFLDDDNGKTDSGSVYVFKAPSPSPPSPPPSPPSPPPSIPISLWSAPTGCYNSAGNLGRSKCNDDSCPDIAWVENSLTSWHESMSLCANVSGASTSYFGANGFICGIGGRVDTHSHKGNTR